MDFSTMYVHLKTGCKATLKCLQRGINWLRGKAKAKPKTKKVFAYELLEKDVLKSPGDIFYLPGKKGVQARVLNKQFKLVCDGRKSYDMIIIEYAAKGVKRDTIVVDAKAELRMPVKLPPKARFMPVYNMLSKWSKALEIKPEF